MTTNVSQGDPVRVTVAQCNTPNKNDRGWPEDPARTSAAIDVMADLGADVVALNEFYSLAAKVWSGRQDWSILRGEPNNVLRSGGELGNAIAYQTHCRLVDSANLKVRTAFRRRGLNFPVALFEALGAEFVVISFHFASGHASIAQVSRRVCLSAVIRAARLILAELGIPVIVAGDTNAGVTAREMLIDAGFQMVAQEGIDVIAVLGGNPDIPILRLPARRGRGVQGTFTDHHAAIAGTIMIPSFRPSRLPDLGNG